MGKIFKGFGTFFYPFISVDFSGKLSLAPKSVDGNWIRKIILKHNVGRFRVLVSDDGFIFPLGTKMKTLEFLNTFFSTSLFYNDLQSKQISVQDLCPCEWEEGKSTITIKTMKASSLRNGIGFNRDGQSTLKRLDAFPRQKITSDKLKEILDHAYKIYNSDLKGEIKLIGYSWSMVFDKDIKPGFLLSWMVIEIFLKKEWNEAIDLSNWPNREKRKAKRFGVYDIIEGLAGIGMISQVAKVALQTKRDTRNNITHSITNANVSKKQMERCSNIASNVFWNVYYDKKPFVGIK